ncbi:MAG: hypothetical protein H0U64_13690 [Gemmatimonadaceae bacterium]|nr:hypothetical protein [Gemmatimonadaceae bacterium]
MREFQGGNFRFALLAGLFVAAFGTPAAAQSLSVSGNPASMNISSATAGSEPVGDGNSATTYSVTTLIIQKKKVTARLSSNMPAGMTLSVSLVAPSGATSMGAVTLDNTDRDLVVNIGNLLAETKSITYQFTGTAAAGALTSSRTVTFSLVNYP